MDALAKTLLVICICVSCFCMWPWAASGQNLRVWQTVPRPEGPQKVPSDAEAVERWRVFYNEENLRAREADEYKLEYVVRDAYLGILGKFAAGSVEEAVELAAELEFRIQADPQCYPREPLRLVRKIAAETPGTALPVALLHKSVWDHSFRRGRFYNLHEKARWALDFARIHAASAPDGDREAADFLTFYAYSLGESSFVDLLPVAVDLLDDAVEHAPDHVPALHLRAVLLERQGFYRKALRDLERLRTLEPKRDDIALRTAVLRIRLGKTERGAALLDELIDRPDSRPWVRVVAYQERIRVELARDAWARAGELSARARAEYSDNHRLALIEADRIRRSTRRPDATVPALLDGLTADPGPTPRLRYLEAPVSDVEESLGRLDRAIRTALPDLARQVKALQEVHPDLHPIHCPWHFKPLSEVPEAQPAAAEPPAPDSAPLEVPAISADALGHEAPPAPPRVVEMEEISDVWVDPETGEKVRLHEVMDLELRQIYVTPDGFGGKIPRLQRSDLRIVDEGKRQEIVTFEQGDVPFTAVLLVDGSGSMDGPKMERALAGSREFIGGMAPLDRLRVLVAADRPRAASPFLTVGESSLERLRGRLSSSAADGGTALFDYLFLAVESMQGLQGRKVVIVLSDGYDLMSAVPMESVRNAVRRSQVQVYWVRPRETPDEPFRRGREEFVPLTGWRSEGETIQQITLLERTVRESGGNVLDIARDDEPAAALRRILHELRSQVAVGYYPDPRRGDGSWRKVEIKGKSLGARLRHASGYFDD